MQRKTPLLALIVLNFSLLGPLLSAEAPALAKAISLFHTHRVPEAHACLSDLLKTEPQNIQALWYLGRCELKLRHYPSAITILDQAVELAPNDDRILADYATAHLLGAEELGVSLRAIVYARRGRNALEKAAVLKPDNLDYREGLVQFYTRAPRIAGGDIDRAYFHINAIAQRSPTRGAIAKANTLCSEKRYTEALAACESLLREQPDNYLILYTVGRIASETGQQLDRGQQALRRCLELTPQVQEPNHASVHHRLGLIAEKASQLAVARQEYEAALALQPAYPEVTAALAKLTPVTSSPDHHYN